jgi:hypothetical protein
MQRWYSFDLNIDNQMRRLMTEGSLSHYRTNFAVPSDVLPLNNPTRCL